MSSHAEADTLKLFHSVTIPDHLMNLNMSMCSFSKYIHDLYDEEYSKAIDCSILEISALFVSMFDFPHTFMTKYSVVV